MSRTQDEKLEEAVDVLRANYRTMLLRTRDLDAANEQVAQIERNYGPNLVDLTLGFTRAISYKWGVCP